MNKQKQHNIGLHIAIFLFGLSGVIAKSLGLSSIFVTFGRVSFSAIFLGVIIIRLKKPFKITSKRLVVIAGILLAVHWTTFFEAIQLGSVAIGTLTFATYPLFTAFLEPLLFKEGFKIKSLYQAFILLVGVGFLVKGETLNPQVLQSVAWGMVSSLTYALLSLCNRALSRENDSVVIACIEQLVAAVILLPNVFIIPVRLTPIALGKLMALGVLCTGIAHTLFIESLKTVKVHVAGIVSGLEPVYGILLAFLLLGEVPLPNELIGGSIILATVLYVSVYQNRLR
jgi:drug/metabolite transporter (DMT)-like permease